MAPTTAPRARKPYSRPAARPQGAEGQWLHDKAPIPALAKQAQANGFANPSARIIVSNLHYEVTPKDLSQIFGQIGTLVREPQIRYDRSGRSSGVAVVSFETPVEATRAKKQFDGILCKNQPMSIASDTAPPPMKGGARRSASTPSLINRIEKAPLLDRLSKNEPKSQAAPAQGGVGPVRNRARGSAARGKAPKRAGPPKPKTIEELDKELDAFMQDDVKPQPAAEPSAAAAPAVPTEDVEMS